MEPCLQHTLVGLGATGTAKSSNAPNGSSCTCGPADALAVAAGSSVPTVERALERVFMPVEVGGWAMICQAALSVPSGICEATYVRIVPQNGVSDRRSKPDLPKKTNGDIIVQSDSDQYQYCIFLSG